MNGDALIDKLLPQTKPRGPLIGNGGRAMGKKLGERRANDEGEEKVEDAHLLQSHRAQMRGWKFLTWQENQKAGGFSLVESS